MVNTIWQKPVFRVPTCVQTKQTLTGTCKCLPCGGRGETTVWAEDLLGQEHGGEASLRVTVGMGSTAETPPLEDRKSSSSERKAKGRQPWHCSPALSALREELTKDKTTSINTKKAKGKDRAIGGHLRQNFLGP